jgi:hypothetical protein
LTTTQIVALGTTGIAAERCQRPGDEHNEIGAMTSTRGLAFTSMQLQSMSGAQIFELFVVIY